MAITFRHPPSESESCYGRLVYLDVTDKSETCQFLITAHEWLLGKLVALSDNPVTSAVFIAQSRMPMALALQWAPRAIVPNGRGMGNCGNKFPANWPMIKPMPARVVHVAYIHQSSDDSASPLW